MPTVHYLNGLCGSGKTEAANDKAAKHIALGERICIAAPSTALLTDIRDRFRAAYPQHSANVHLITHETHKSDVCRSIEEHTRINRQAQLLLITHQALMGVARWHDAKQWTLIVDEEMDLLHDLTLISTFGSAKTFWLRYFADYINVRDGQLTFKADLSQPSLTASVVESGFQDVVENLNKHLASPNFRVNIDPKQWNEYVGEGREKLDIWAQFNADIFAQFRSVTLMGARIEHGFMMAYLRMAGFTAKSATMKTRFNGHNQFVTTKWGFDRKYWSRTFYIKKHHLKPVMHHWMDAVRRDIGTQNILVQSNAAQPWPTDMRNKIELPFKSEGLNKYTETHHYAEAGAYNWSPDFTNRLKALGFDTDDIQLHRAVNHAYQGAMRTSLRLGQDNSSVIYVPTKAMAEMLRSLYFPNATVERVTGCEDVATRQPMAPRSKAPKTAAERMREMRRRKALLRKQAA